MMAEDFTTPRPLSEWHEDMGDVLWWKFPIVEPPYCGSPLDLGKTVQVNVWGIRIDETMRVHVGGWPGYHTHWTPIPRPSKPKRGKK
jgi:hypothetical protein